MLKKMTLCLLLAALFVAHTAQVSHGGPAAPPPAPTVAYQTVDTGRISSIREPSELVIRDAAAWTALWQRHAGTARPVPAINFDKDMVIAVFAGESVWSNALVVLRIVREPDRLVVFYAMADMKPLPISQQVTSAMPFHIVRVPKSGMTVWFSLMKSS